LIIHVAAGETRMTLIADRHHLEYEIKCMGRLIDELENTHAEARGYLDDDVKRSVTDGIGAVIQALQEARAKLQYQLEHPGSALSKNMPADEKCVGF
jgi:hypothetical protein